MNGVATATLLPDPPRRRHEEDTLQKQVVAFLRVALPSNAVAFHVPNGGLRHRKAAARLVGLGVRAGVPDLAVVWRGNAVFIELKAPRGTLSPAQRDMIDLLTVCGAHVLVCRSLECVESGLRELGIPLRATAGDWRPRSRVYDQAQLAIGRMT